MVKPALLQSPSTDSVYLAKQLFKACESLLHERLAQHSGTPGDSVARHSAQGADPGQCQFYLEKLPAGATASAVVGGEATASTAAAAEPTHKDGEASASGRYIIHTAASPVILEFGNNGLNR